MNTPQTSPQFTPGPQSPLFPHTWTLTDNKSPEYAADTYLIKATFPAQNRCEQFTTTVAHVRMQERTTAGKHTLDVARLIAAAPELLAALQQLSSAIEALDDDTEELPFTTRLGLVRELAHDCARKAIAKATKGTP